MEASIEPQSATLTKQIAALLQQHYGLQGLLQPLPGYSDLNFLLQLGDTGRYIVKVANSAESLAVLDLQNKAMQALAAADIAVPEALANRAGTLITAIDLHGEARWLRVLSYLPGRCYGELTQADKGPALWQQLGELLGKVSHGFANFEHVAAYRELDWDLATAYRLCRKKIYLLSAQRESLVQHFLALYQQQVRPVLSQLPQSVIHNDANDYNLLLQKADLGWQITGLLDFGDMLYSHTINELAVACAYAILNQADPVQVIKTVTAAYHQQHPLTETELQVLPCLIALRLCLSLCNSAQASLAEPDNQYILISATAAEQALIQLQQLDFIWVGQLLKQQCLGQVEPGRSGHELRQLRQRYFSKTLSLSYQQPLKIVRGSGAYLYDEAGLDYLDMVNNVCHVGHCHPQVVAAGQQQMALLNTNTRYLHDNLVDYAEQLLATMPSELSVCFFVNSGSEANELAFRLARAATGQRDLIVVDGAYHGNTQACIDASPYKFDGPGGEGAAAHIHKVLLPDPYRGRYQGYSQATGAAYAADISRALADISAAGRQVSAFICESLQGVAGQIVMPDGYLQQVYSLVRAAGGLCIADEVQVGFGRVGSQMWGFQTQRVVPDIVTLGKPIGNGHPMAAVITTRAIADAFANGMEFFNTFGGNPVSCAIGSAVLKVLQQEQLPQRALETGLYLQQQLRQLQQQYPIIGDVRGMGLFLGVELVTDRQSKTAATAEMAWLVEFMKQQRILLSSEGPDANILKMKPPLVFGRNEANRFLESFSQGLSVMQTLNFTP
ncbi:MAG: aminotransferase class III-fold pyridoxal phosphate-dependent enzyme [Gammaproteobacteria bacterium]|nr:aminotransferase class III-fold pyridoxal phosphate-dependent enzyme [Gammaproteobacteria bacterium]